MARRTGILAAIAALVSGCSATAALNALVPASTYEGREGVAYGAGARERLDVYRPLPGTARGPAPIVVFFYGGNWDAGERANYRFVGEFLAASGAIGVNAFDDEEVALELLAYLMARYPQEIQARYKLADIAGMTDEELLDAIGRQRGAIQSGGRVNTTKAAELVIHDLRSGALGRITLETPEEFARWLAEGKKADAERAARKEEFAKAKAENASRRGRTRR